MDFVRQWTITIVSVIIFITFVEILIPNSNNKRYINVVVGFLLMIIILNPLTKFIAGEIDFEESILKSLNQIEAETAKNVINNIQYSNEEMVISLYKKKIVEQVTTRLEKNTDYLVKDVLVNIVEDINSANFGSVSSLDITLTENQKDNVELESKIKPVKINVSLGDKINNTVKANSILISSEEDALKKELENFLNVSKENINIYTLKNNN
ncbi:stage III sporulation protein AF [Alkaliphilus oremlandii]|uniref:Sporulation stage III protein AF n=1 Tax=Alkaliphilus oremlandii (strain OhILAs) TaxID=350688 RepID=A8MFJ7_ALKOO|nr:stage III sporulation protein AF [Alkaliphilus oremlandii]ABW19160.1 Sporulation stage III protein AF [Alkaliphilus oremlandii OhILAs]